MIADADFDFTDEEAEQYARARSLILSCIAICTDRGWPVVREVWEDRLNSLNPYRGEFVEELIRHTEQWLGVFDQRRNND